MKSFLTEQKKEVSLKHNGGHGQSQHVHNIGHGHGQSSPTLWTFLTRPGLNMTRQSTGEGRGLELQSSSQFVIISKYLQILERD